MWRGKLLPLPTSEQNRVQQSCMGWPNEYKIINILQNRINVVSYNICLVKKFDSDQTLYNKIQHDTTRYNKVAKRVQYFIQHQSCLMLYEMLCSFGRGLIRIMLTDSFDLLLASIIIEKMSFYFGKHS